MIPILFVGAAAAGSMARWYTAELAPPPMGTLFVNLLGAFVLGWLHGSATTTQLVVGTAAIGSLTTFSTLVIEILELARTRPRHAAYYAVATLGGGTGAAWLGLTLG